MSGIAPKQNAFKFKIAPHKQKSIVKKKKKQQEDGPPGQRCTPKDNGKSDTEHDQLQRSLNEGTVYYNQVPIKIRLKIISHIEDELITLNNKILCMQFVWFDKATD